MYHNHSDHFKVGDYVLYHGHISRVDAILGHKRRDRSLATGRFRPGYIEPTICFTFWGAPYIMEEGELLKHQTPWYNDHGTWTRLYERPT